MKDLSGRDRSHAVSTGKIGETEELLKSSGNKRALG